MQYTDFNVIGLESEKVYGKIPLRTESSMFLKWYEFDEASLEALSEFVPYGDFSGAIVHKDLDGHMTLWLDGYPIFGLQPSTVGVSTGCKICGDPGKFVRMALVCSIHGTLIGGC